MEENTMIPSDPCEATSTCNSYRKDSFLQKLNCAMNRQNNINMGCNGEDTCTHPAGRICVSQSGQEQPGVYPAGRRPAGPLQVAKGVGQVGFAALEFVRVPHRSQGAKVQLSLLYNLALIKYNVIVDAPWNTLKTAILVKSYVRKIVIFD